MYLVPLLTPEAYCPYSVILPRTMNLMNLELKGRGLRVGVKELGLKGWDERVGVKVKGLG